MNPKVVPGAKARLIDMWVAGEHAITIAKELGITEKKVYDRAGQYGLPRRSPKSWLDAKTAVQLHKQGLTYTEIANRLGCSRSGITQAIHKELKK